MRTVTVFSACLAVLVVNVCAQSAGQQPQTKDLVKPPDRGVGAIVHSVCFSPDGRFLAAGAALANGKGEAVAWDAKTHLVRWRHRADKGVISVAFSPDSKTVAAGSLTENFLVLDADSGKLKATLSGHGEAARRVALSSDGQTLAVAGDDGQIRLWDYQSGKQIRSWTVRDRSTYGLAFAPDGKSLASGGDATAAYLWDPTDGKMLRSWRVFELAVYSVAFDPKGQWLAIGSADGSLKFRELVGDKLLVNFSGGSAKSLAVHPAGKAVAVTRSSGNYAQIFTLDFREATAQEQKKIRQLIGQWDDDRLEVRDKASAELQKLGPIAEPFLAKLMKDGASADIRMRARLTRAAIRSPEPAFRLEGHRDQVNCVAYSADGKLLATGARDGFVILWETTGYQLAAKLRWPD